MKSRIIISVLIFLCWIFGLQAQAAMAEEDSKDLRVMKLEASESGVFIFPVLSKNAKPIGEMPTGVAIEIIKTETIEGQTWFLVQPKGVKGLRRGWVPASSKLKLIKESKTGSPTTIEIMQSPQDSTSTLFPKTQPKEKKEPEWKMKFSKKQKETLRNYKCLFDDLDRKISNRMAKRGFTPEQFVTAYGQSKAMGFVNRLEIENIAAVNFLNLPVTEYKDYRYYYDAEGDFYTYSPGNPGVVTDFYNYRIGGKWPWLIGAAVMGAGAGATIAGLGVLLTVSGCNSSCDSYARCSTCRNNEQLGYIITGVGVATIGGGLGLFIPSNKKVKRWAPNKKLDDGTVEELEKYKQKGNKSYSVLPSLYGLNSKTTNMDDQRAQGYYLGFLPYFSNESNGVWIIFQF